VQITAAGALTTENAKAPAPIAAPRSVLLIGVIAKLPFCVSQAANDSARAGFRRNVRMRSFSGSSALESHYVFDRHRTFESLAPTMVERFGAVTR
jgi:hypothetical protein